MYDDDKNELNTINTNQRRVGDYQMERGTNPGIEGIIDKSDNVCEIIDDSDLTTISNELCDDIEEDRRSMGPWLKLYKNAMRLAKLEPREKVKTFPFDNASNIMCPYILEAAIDFNARIVPGLIERKNICKSNITGEEEELYFFIGPQGEQQIDQQTYQKAQQLLGQVQEGQQPPFQLEQRKSTEKKDTADRRTKVINWDLTVGIDGWRESKDKEMMALPVCGTTFRLNRQSAFENKRISTLIYPDKLICNHDQQIFSDDLNKSFEYDMNKNDVISSMRTGQFKDVDLKQYEHDKTIKFIESHCWLDLDDDDFNEPYIVTILKDMSQIVSIIPRFGMEDVFINKENKVCRIDPEEYFTQTVFLPDPSGGFMGMGWGILLSGLFEAINTNTNQTIDAATLQNSGMNSGFIRGGQLNSRGGGRERKGEVDVTLGHFNYIEASGSGALKDDIVNFPFNGPSPALIQLMEGLKEEVRQMTRATGVEAMANEAAEMYLARLQQALTIPNAINCRVLSGVTSEVKRISDIISNYMGQEEYKRILNDEKADWTGDFEDGEYDIAMTADPTQGSQQEQIARATMIKNEAMQNPALDPRKAYMKWFEAIGVQDPEEYLKPAEDGKPDPLQEMQAQAVKQMSEAEMMKGQADIITAQSRMLTANTQAQETQQKMESEIDKLESETMKNLSEVDKNERDSVLKNRQQSLDNLENKMKRLREQLKDERDDSRENRKLDADIGIRAKELVQKSNN